MNQQMDGESGPGVYYLFVKLNGIRSEMGWRWLRKTQAQAEMEMEMEK